jgi:hypothetical protein
MNKIFGMFVLTRREQRVVVFPVLALVIVAIAKRYRENRPLTPPALSVEQMGPKDNCKPPVSDGTSNDV